MKLVFGSLLGLLAFGLSSANAQFSPLYGSPLTSPLQSPFGNPYNPYSIFGSPFSFYGNPALRGYAGMQAGQTGPFGSNTTGISIQNLGDPSMTGHPTRFFSYSQYFFTQGGMTSSGTGLPTSGSGLPQAAGAGVIGSAPPRPRTNPRP